MTNIKLTIADDLHIPVEMVDKAIQATFGQVGIFTIPKRSGGERTIYHPSRNLKMIQYWLMHRIFSKIRVHEASMAYRKDISILDNANAHRKNRFFLKMDFKDFFPSIQFSDFLPILRDYMHRKDFLWVDDAEWIENIVMNTCFYKGKSLAVGYPCAPVISNIVMYDFDVRVSKMISENEFKDVVYTRYADDLVFSTNQTGMCNRIKFEILNIVRGMATPILKINHEKTKFGSSTGGTALVTGLKICGDKRVTIHKKQKDHIRLLLTLFKKGNLNKDEYSSLRGHLSYIRHVDPGFYTKLSCKFYKEIREVFSAGANELSF